jgi:hypothetical protein
MSENPLLFSLVKYVLPSEFDLIHLEEIVETLHIHLDEFRNCLNFIF